MLSPRHFHVLASGEESADAYLGGQELLGKFQAQAWALKNESVFGGLFRDDKGLEQLEQVTEFLERMISDEEGRFRQERAGMSAYSVNTGLPTDWRNSKISTGV